MTDAQPSLPANQAFVVQFRAQTQDTPPRCEGRIEHLLSGEVARFQSLDELWRFIARILHDVQDQ